MYLADLVRNGFDYSNQYTIPANMPIGIVKGFVVININYCQGKGDLC